MRYVRSTARPRALVAAAAATLASLAIIGAARADGIHAETLLPSTGIGVEFGWAGAEFSDAYDLLVRGGYQNGVMGTEIYVPLGWYSLEGQDTEFAVGNIGLQGRAGTALNLGAIDLALAGGLTAYIPTASEPMNASLAAIQLLRPGLRQVDAVPIELAASATVAVAMVELTGTFGATIVFPTDGETRTFSWLHGGFALGVYVLPLLEIVGEYAVAARTGSGAQDLHQLGAGILLDVDVVQLGINARIPIGGEQLDDAPVVLGLDFRAGF